MRYDLVVTDFDNTLCPHGKNVSDYTLNVINEYIAKGGKFVIETGRMNSSIAPIAKLLGLKGDIVSCQGAVIKDIQSNNLLYNVGIDKKTAYEYIRFLEDRGIIVQFYKGNDLYTVEANHFTKDYGSFCKVSFHYTHRKLSEYINLFDSVDMIYCYVEPKIKFQFMDEIKEKFGDRLEINTSAPYNVECINKKTSKGIALKWLANKYDIDISKTIAFGDSLNDKTMIDVAGLGVAVNNADKRLIASADYVCESCENDGLAKTIEKYCLKEK